VLRDACSRFATLLMSRGRAHLQVRSQNFQVDKISQVDINEKNCMNVEFVNTFTLRPIGFVSSPYHATADVPRGLGAKHGAEGILKIVPEFADGLKDIEGFSHLFVIWAFDRSQGFELLGTPPSDNRPHGVFATRSPRRPNPIALTVVELLSREDALLHVRGVDMLDGTPILDIKPYLSSIPEQKLRRGWLAEAEARQKA
jgi:tRNA (adenine37-N6)-methyltransferase